MKISIPDRYSHSATLTNLKIIKAHNYYEIGCEKTAYFFLKFSPISQLLFLFKYTKKKIAGKNKNIFQPHLFRHINPKTISFLALPVMTISFWTDRSGETVQTQIILLLEEQSDQGLHCLLFHLHHFDKIP